MKSGHLSFVDKICFIPNKNKEVTYVIFIVYCQVVIPIIAIYNVNL